MKYLNSPLVSLLAFFVACAPLAHSQVVVADMVEDYSTSGPISASGSGTWSYFASTAISGGSLSALTYQTVGGIGNQGYGLTGHDGTNMPAVSDMRLFFDGAFPNGNYLAWHPGNTSPLYTIVRWTAGAGESGPAHVQGNFSRVGEPTVESVNFYIYVNNSVVFTRSAISSGTQFSFDVTAPVLAGQYIDFVLDPNGNYYGDESMINATISMNVIPEPSSYAGVAGVAILGFAAFNRRRSRSL